MQQLYFRIKTGLSLISETSADKQLSFILTLLFMKEHFTFVSCHVVSGMNFGIANDCINLNENTNFHR